MAPGELIDCDIETGHWRNALHPLELLHKNLGEALPEPHRTRLRAWIASVEGLLRGRRSWLSGLGRDRPGRAKVEMRGQTTHAQKWSVPEGRMAQAPPIVADEEDEDRACGIHSFSGAYAIKSGNRISFGEHLAMTMMACPDRLTKEQFLETLRNAANDAVAEEWRRDSACSRVSEVHYLADAGTTRIVFARPG